MDDKSGWLVLAAFIAVGILLDWTNRRSRDRRTLARARTAPIAAAKDGAWALVTGTLEAVGPAMTSPVGGETCIGFRLEVRPAGEDESPVWTKEDAGAFSVADRTGTMHVEGPLRIVVEQKDDWARMAREDLDLLEEADVRTTGLLGDPTFEYREWLLQPGDLVSVFGLVFLEPDPAAPAAGLRAAPLIRRMRGSAERPLLVQPAERPARG
ncbi:MAG TPA: hypothetical protein VIF57_04495 [Polyangia bacterium]|jgi:hypothetical protein